jgi:hypothetical protein
LSEGLKAVNTSEGCFIVVFISCYAPTSLNRN